MNAVSCGLLLYFVSNVSGYPKLQVVQVLLLVVLVHVDDLVPAGSCIIPTGSYSFILLDWFLLVVVLLLLVTVGLATATVRTLEAGPFDIIATIDGNEVVVTESLIRTQLQLDDVNGLYEFTLHDVLDGMRAIGYPTNGSLTFYKAKLSPQWRFLIHTLIHSAAHDVSPPPIVPPIHSTPGPSSALQVTHVREPTPVRDPTPMRDLTPVRDPTPVREPTPSPMREPTPDSPRPPSPPPITEEVGPTTSTRPPSPTRHTSVHEDISEGGGDFVSSPQFNEAPQTPAATAVGRAEDSAALTALSLKFDRCLHRVSTLENELGITKKRLVLSDSEGEDATPTEHDIDLASLHTLAHVYLGGDSSAPAAGPDAYTTMPFRSTSTTRRRLRKPFTSYASAYVSENIPAGVSVLAAATTISAGSSVDAAVHAAAAPSSFIPTTVDTGKAPMVDDSLPTDLLSEQERVLKNLHDSQLGRELEKKIHAKQEAEFARQQEELAQKAQAERVTSPTEHDPGMFDHRRRELDAARLIYTEADWLELLAKIATNVAISKQLLGDDVTEENMNERLGMLLLRKRRKLAEQSRIKPMTKTQQRDYMRDFVKNNSASVRSAFRPKPTLDAPSAKRVNQGAPQVPTASSQVPAGVRAAPSFHTDVSAHAATSSAPADISVPAVSPAHVAASVPAATVHIAKKRVTPIVDMVDAAMIKFKSDSDSDDDPLPYAPYAGWEMVPSPLGSVYAYHDMAGNTKHFTTLREPLYMVEKTDLQKLLGAVDELYQKEELDTFALLLWGDLHVLFQSLDDEDALDFWHVSYPLTVATLERMLKLGLEVPNLLVGGDLTMAEQLISFIKAALLNAKSAA
nr:hypothetical protein [Tanacetum cinerariifolium]